MLRGGLRWQDVTRGRATEQSEVAGNDVEAQAVQRIASLALRLRFRARRKGVVALFVAGAARSTVVVVGVVKVRRSDLASLQSNGLAAPNIAAWARDALSSRKSG